MDAKSLKTRQSCTLNSSSNFALGSQFADCSIRRQSNSVAPSGEYVGNFDYTYFSTAPTSMLPTPRVVGCIIGNMTSSTKPEVYNICHCRQSRTELHPDKTYRKFVRFERVDFEISDWTNRQTDRQTYRQVHRSTSHLCQRRSNNTLLIKYATFP